MNSISEQTHQIFVHGLQLRSGMIIGMDDLEIDLLRKTIRKTYAGQPHKVKFWLALLDMYGRGIPGSKIREPQDWEGRSESAAYRGSHGRARSDR
jgi:hypothetical protein